MVVKVLDRINKSPWLGRTRRRLHYSSLEDDVNQILPTSHKQILSLHHMDQPRNIIFPANKEGGDEKNGGNQTRNPMGMRSRGGWGGRRASRELTGNEKYTGAELGFEVMKGEGEIRVDGIVVASVVFCSRWWQSERRSWDGKIDRWVRKEMGLLLIYRSIKKWTLQICLLHHE